MDNVEKWNYDQRAVDQWCKMVGGEQKLLPAHVVNEYCRADRPFEPCPQEWESKLPRTREMDVWDSTQSKTVKGSWFVPPSSKDGLGLNFAFYRYRAVTGVGGGRARWACCGGRRPQSSPILVEDTYAGVGVPEVPIIVRYQSEAIRVAINRRCNPNQRRFKHVGKVAPSLEKIVDGNQNSGIAEFGNRDYPEHHDSGKY